MKTVKRSVINAAARNLVNDPNRWSILKDRDPSKIRAVRNAVQDFKYNGGSIREVGTALAWCIGYISIKEAE